MPGGDACMDSCFMKQRMNYLLATLMYLFSMLSLQKMAQRTGENRVRGERVLPEDLGALARRGKQVESVRYCSRTLSSQVLS